MADLADITEQRSDILKRAELHNSKRHSVTAVAIGECLYCEENLPPGLRWCGAECRNDWEKENAA